MQKTKRQKIMGLAITTCLCLGSALTTHAADNTEPPLLGRNLIWNIESIYYYVNSSAISYVTPIANAANNWVYTGYGWNNLYPNTRTYTLSNSAIDIYGYSKADGNNGYTSFWARTNVTSGTAYKVDPDIENWLFNEIYLNDNYLSKGKDTTYIQGVVAHEMGHCFGLNENNTNQYSIMCQAARGRKVYKVQKVDQNSFNRKHP